MPVDFLGPGGHDGARGRVGPMVRVSVGVRGVMGRERRAAGGGGGGGTGGGGGGVAGITGGSGRGVAVSRLAHLRAGAEVAVAALHLAGGQGAAGRFEAGGRRSRGLVEIRVVHGDAVGSAGGSCCYADGTWVSRGRNPAKPHQHGGTSSGKEVEREREREGVRMTNGTWEDRRRRVSRSSPHR